MAIVQPPRPRQPGQGGFTLMEVLIAVSITAVIGLGIWQVLSGVITSRDRVDAVADEFDGLQRALLLMERDITQAVNRTSRNIYGDTEPALTSRNEQFDLILTRQGWRNPLGTRRSELQRVAYEYTGEELRRRFWLTVDLGQEDNSRDQLLLEQVKQLEFEFLDSNNNWVESWPTQEMLNNAMTSGMAALSLPRAIRIRLEHERFGDIERLFVLPEFDQVAVQRFIRDSQSSGDDDDGDDGDDDGRGDDGTAAEGAQ